MIKTLIFDIGNVVLYFDHEKMVNQVAKALQVPFTQVKKCFFDDGLLNAFEIGTVSTDEVLAELLKLTTQPPPKPHILTAYNAIFVENLSLIPIIHSLKKQGKRLILLSNISEPHFIYAKNTFASIALFDDAILSYEVRHAKPDQEIYKAVLAKANCLPYECFYTDDILGHIQSARLQSIDAEQYLSTERLTEQLAKRMIFI